MFKILLQKLLGTYKPFSLVDEDTEMYTTVPLIFRDRFENRQPKSLTAFRLFLKRFQGVDKITLYKILETDINETLFHINGVALVNFVTLDGLEYGIACPSEIENKEHFTLFEDMLEFVRSQVRADVEVEKLIA